MSAEADLPDEDDAPPMCAREIRVRVAALAYFSPEHLPALKADPSFRAGWRLLGPDDKAEIGALVERAKRHRETPAAPRKTLHDPGPDPSR